jgi:hypothetical protein
MIKPTIAAHDDCLQRKLHGFGATACGIQQASSHMDMIAELSSSILKLPSSGFIAKREKSTGGCTSDPWLPH